MNFNAFCDIGKGSKIMNFLKLSRHLYYLYSYVRVNDIYKNKWCHEFIDRKYWKLKYLKVSVIFCLYLFSYLNVPKKGEEKF